MKIFVLISLIYLCGANLFAEGMRIANSKEVESLDPVLVDGAHGNLVAGSLFEGLVGRDPETAVPVPAAAKAWSVSTDGKTYTFTLRKNARWSDGQDLIAQNFVDAWVRALKPESRASYANYLEGIVGAAALRKGETKDFTSLGIRALDSKTLEVKLAEPDENFLELLTAPVFYPVRLDRIKKGSEQWARVGMVGNGPFVLKEWELNRHLIVEPNPHYWDRGAVKSKQIRFLPVPSPKTALQMYESGEVDWIRIVPRTEFPKLQERSDFHVTPVAGTVYLRLNTTHGPLKDARVRRAISLALDRQLIAEKFAREGQVPATRFVAPGIPNYPTQPLVKEDVKQAKALLAEAGYPGGKGFPTLELLYISDPQSKSVTLAVSTLLKRNLGIPVAPRNMERGSYYDRLDSLSYHLARSSWSAKYMDAMNFLEKFTSKNVWQNLTGYGDADFDQLIEKARKAKAQERAELLHQAEHKLLVDDAAIIPLYYNVSTNLWKPNVAGLYPNPLDIHPLKSVHKSAVMAKRKP